MILNTTNQNMAWSALVALKLIQEMGLSHLDCTLQEHWVQGQIVIRCTPSKTSTTIAWEYSSKVHPLLTLLGPDVKMKLTLQQGSETPELTIIISNVVFPPRPGQ